MEGWKDTFLHIHMHNALNYLSVISETLPIYYTFKPTLFINAFVAVIMCIDKNLNSGLIIFCLQEVLHDQSRNLLTLDSGGWAFESVRMA